KPSGFVLEIQEQRVQRPTSLEVAAARLAALRHLQYARPSVRPVGSGVPLAACGSVELPDPGRIKYLLVDGDGVSVEACSQAFENASNEGTIVCGQINPIEQVITVSGVGQDRQRPSLTR